MCFVSLLTESFPQQYPQWTVPTLPLQQALDLREVLRRLDELDRKLGARECPKDAPKQKFLKELEARIKKLEDLQTGGV